MGRWATGRSLLANRRLYLHHRVYSVAGPARRFRRSLCLLTLLLAPMAPLSAKEEPWSSPRRRSPSIPRCSSSGKTMIVSLEAIFLSTFVMISQNRQDDARRHLADQEWLMVQSEEQQNVELIELSNQMLELTKAIHQLTLAHTASVDCPTSDST